MQIQDTSKDLADCNKEEVQTDINTAKDVIADADNSKQVRSLGGEGRGMVEREGGNKEDV